VARDDADVAAGDLEPVSNVVDDRGVGVTMHRWLANPNFQDRAIPYLPLSCGARRLGCWLCIGRAAVGNTLKEADTVLTWDRGLALMVVASYVLVHAWRSWSFRPPRWSNRVARRWRPLLVPDTADGLESA
jgi:hypothetical protein